MSNSTTQPDDQPRAALYARVSTGEGMQADGFSIEAQFTEMREFAAHRGWEVVAEFVDIGVSGTKTERPQLDAMKAAAAEHAFDVLLVHDLSRLSRASVYETFGIFEYLGKHDVGFASVKEPQFDYSTSTGRLFLTFLAGINQYYIDQLKMHTRKSKHQRARDGLYNASLLPYGYRHAGGTRTPPEIVTEEATVVKLIFEKYATARFSYQDLADFLNAHGHTTRKGKRFSKDTIADMLRNPFYAGKIAYKRGRHAQDAGEIYTGQHEAIISLGLWEVCGEVRASHHNASRPFQPQVRTYLLGQLTHCHVCGRHLRSQHSRSHAYYREMSNARGFDDCPNARRGTRADPLHAQIHAIVRQLHLPPDWQEEIAALVGEDEEAASLNNQRARLVAERRHLKRDRQRGVYDDDEDLFYAGLERIRRELALLPTAADLARLEQAAVKLERLHEVWDDATEQDQHDLLLLMLRRVTVDVVQSRLVLLFPTAPFIPLFRAIPLLRERDLGAFVPSWPPDIAETLPLPYTICPSITALPDEPVTLPFLPVWPWPSARTRITPALSDALKARRQAGLEGGLVLDVPQRGVPPLRLDSRKWPTVSLTQTTLSAALEGPDDTLAFLYTPLVVQEHPDRETLAQRVYERLAPHGIWHWIDLSFVSMPAHWLFTYFPDTWPYVQDAYWSTYRIFNQLRKIGFTVEEKESTCYQPLRLETVQAIAQQRPGLLQLLQDAVYEKGMAQLAEEITQQGAESLIGSEVTLVTVTARKGDN